MIPYIFGIAHPKKRRCMILQNHPGKQLYVLSFKDIDRTKFMLTGSKGANLSELCKIEGIKVPDGFCITTEAYKRIMENNDELSSLLDDLAHLTAVDRDSIHVTSAKIRTAIETAPVPEDIADEIESYLSKFGGNDAYAVRSSATAEDLPAASFAGQQDTYLNIIGKQSILQHITKCQASLFTDRAVTYRIQNNFDHRKVQLSVVVQKMVFPQAAGILFTADPVNGNRKVLSIDAGFGLGEALVSGLVNADVYKVRSGKITDKKVATKNLAIYALKGGGTEEREVVPEQQSRQVLTDDEILQLEQTGRKIEAHFGQPQDIEWCLAEGTFYIVQSRPITTLFPVPPATDNQNHVYVSVGHQQMMTDAMKPLGLSVWLLMPSRHMDTAAGRLFVDVSRQLASVAGRQMLMDTIGKSDPLIKDALTTIMERSDFIPVLQNDDQAQNAADNKAGLPLDFRSRLENDPAIVTRLISSNQTHIEALKQNILTKSGPELFDFIQEDILQLRTVLFVPESMGAIVTAMNTTLWINDKMNEWLGEKNAADALSQSAPNNITSEMGLDLMNVADVIRPYPQLIDYLQHIEDDNFLGALTKFDGGQEAVETITTFLDKYGMRCSGEIDITKTRWSEQPSTLAPVILSNIKNFEAGAANKKFQRGLQEAMTKEQELLGRLKQLPDGEQKAEETKWMIYLLRSFIGYREYPKYSIVSRYYIYKMALLKEANRLLQNNVIHDNEDVYYLTFQEFREAVRANDVDYQLISQRKQEYKAYEKLTPPRVITSDGEIITGAYTHENLPVSAIAGLPVSSGIIEGRARVILNMAGANIEDGDILVTTFTDPSWTPLFVSIKGLVTEVGGLMTHGAVIAREYGLPAVVGVENATRLITNGQRIRVNGTDGYVEIL